MQYVLRDAEADARGGPRVPELPGGTVAFLFTDIARSTRLWHHYPQAMQAAYTRHDEILTDAITRHGGVRYKVIGDAYQVAFPTAPGAVAAAFDAQRQLTIEDWAALGLPEPLRVRMALHVGAVEPDPDGDYRSPVLNRLGRLLSAGHGGQMVLSDAAMGLVRGQVPAMVSFVDLGAHRLKDLLESEHIWQLVHPDLPHDFPPLATLDQQRHNLPLQPTPFIGREHDVPAVVALLRRDGVRLATLTGPGGTGKTRLALQVASEVVEDYPDGVWFVPLASLGDADVVMSAIATAVHVQQSSHVPLIDDVTTWFRDKHSLLLLDNFEHVMAASTVIDVLLAACPRLTVFVTSRARLQLYGEQEYAVPPLGLPEPGQLPTLEQLALFDAIRLFVERARAVKADFEITAANAEAVAGICQRLDGLPLAIELAATRVKVLPPQAMLPRLERRLSLVTGGARNLPTRQQTLRQAIAWSYDLLDSTDQQLFRWLTVFAGGWSLDVAEAVAGPTAPDSCDRDVLDGLSALVEHNLVRQHDGPAGSARFGMLETIREYGWEQLEEHGEAADMQERHAHYFHQWTTAAQPHLSGSDQEEWLDALELDHNNLRAALSWSSRHAPSLMAGIAGGLWRFWWVRGHWSEGRRWLELATTAAGGTARDLSYVYLGASSIAADQGDLVTAAAYGEDCLARYREVGDRAGVAYALNNLGTIAGMRGDVDTARGLFEEAQATAHDAGDRRTAMVALANLGHLALDAGHPHVAQQMDEAALAIAEQLGDVVSIAALLTNLGILALSQGDDGAAIRFAERSLVVARRLGDRHRIVSGLSLLGLTALERGRVAEAYARYHEALEAVREIEAMSITVDCLYGIAVVFASQDDVLAAARLVGAAAALTDRAGLMPGPTEQLIYTRHLEPARAALGEAAWRSASDVGRTMGLDAAIEMALGRVAVTDRVILSGETI